MQINQTSFLELKIPPPVVFVLFAACQWVLSLAMPWGDFAFPLHKVAAGFAVLGGAFGLGGILSFLRARTTIDPHNPRKSSALVVDGVYAITRNPMYLALLLVLIAWAGYLSNGLSFLPLPFFVAYLNRFQIMPEERVLASLFGSEFDIYCKRVPRWFCHMRSRTK